MSSSELRMAVRRALNEWGSTEERCKQLLREVNEQMAIAEAAGSVHAQIMTGMPHGSGVSDPVSHAAEIAESARQRAMDKLDEIDRLQARKANMDARLAALPDDQRRVLLYKYAYGWRMDSKVPYMMHASRRTCFRILDAAIDNLARFGTQLDLY